MVLNMVPTFHPNIPIDLQSPLGHFVSSIAIVNYFPLECLGYILVLWGQNLWKYNLVFPVMQAFLLHETP